MSTLTASLSASSGNRPMPTSPPPFLWEEGSVGDVASGLVKTDKEDTVGVCGRKTSETTLPEDELAQDSAAAFRVPRNSEGMQKESSSNADSASKGTTGADSSNSTMDPFVGSALTRRILTGLPTAKGKAFIRKSSTTVEPQITKAEENVGSLDSSSQTSCKRGSGYYMPERIKESHKLAVVRKRSVETDETRRYTKEHHSPSFSPKDGSQKRRLSKVGAQQRDSPLLKRPRRLSKKNLATARRAAALQAAAAQSLFLPPAAPAVYPHLIAGQASAASLPFMQHVDPRHWNGWLGASPGLGFGTNMFLPPGLQPSITLQDYAAMSAGVNPYLIPSAANPFLQATPLQLTNPNLTSYLGAAAAAAAAGNSQMEAASAVAAAAAAAAAAPPSAAPNVNACDPIVFYSDDDDDGEQSSDTAKNKALERDPNSGNPRALASTSNTDGLEERWSLVEPCRQMGAKVEIGINDPDAAASATRRGSFSFSETKREYIEGPPREMDVKSFKGNQVAPCVSAGNKYYRALIQQYRESFSMTNSRKHKTKVCGVVVMKVLAAGGRFVRQEKDGYRYYLLTHKEALKKTSKAMNDSSKQAIIRERKEIPIEI